MISFIPTFFYLVSFHRHWVTIRRTAGAISFPFYYFHPLTSIRTFIPTFIPNFASDIINIFNRRSMWLREWCYLMIFLYLWEFAFGWIWMVIYFVDFILDIYCSNFLQTTGEFELVSTIRESKPSALVTPKGSCRSWVNILFWFWYHHNQMTLKIYYTVIPHEESVSQKPN